MKKYVISFLQMVNGEWTEINSESYAFVNDARERFFSACASCFNSADAVTIIWRRTVQRPKEMGRFKVQPL